MMNASRSIRNKLAILLGFCILLPGCTRPDPSARLKPLVDSYVAAWNTGEFGDLANVVSQDFELRMTPRFNPIRGIDSLEHAITSWRTAYPDFTLSIDETLFAEDMIAARWTIHATNTGPGTHPPTGRPVVVSGMSILHISGGKISDEWIASNNLSWMQQLGFTMMPPKSSP